MSKLEHWKSTCFIKILIAELYGQKIKMKILNLEIFFKSRERKTSLTSVIISEISMDNAIVQ